MNSLEFILDGKPVVVSSSPADVAADVLRALGKPVRVLCDQGVCGACTILVAGVPTTSCCLPASVLSGEPVETASSVAFRPSANTLATPGAFQCGMCAPGICCSLVGTHDDEPSAVLDGHLCRCTGYVPLLEALTRPHTEIPPDLEMRKLRGDDQFAFDLVPDGALHVALVRSPVAHGEIEFVDTRVAERTPGVQLVLTGANVPQHPFGYILKDQPVIARTKVRYRGDIVAAVAADDLRTAHRAAASVQLKIRALPEMYSVGDATAPGASLIGKEEPWEGIDTRPSRYARRQFFPEGNVACRFALDVGAPDWDACDWAYEDEFTYEPSAHLHLEPHVCVAYPSAGGVRLVTSTQRPFSVREQISEIFDLALEDVEVVVPRVGGGFGAKGMVRAEAIASAVCISTGRPARLAMSMTDSMMTVRQHAAHIRLRTGGRANGTVLYRSVEVELDAGAYTDASSLVLPKVVYRAFGPYRWSAVTGRGDAVLTNSVPACGFRGFGGPQAIFAGERQIDLIAARLGMDPLEFRRQNLLAVGERYIGVDSPMDSDLRAGLDVVVNSVSSRLETSHSSRAHIGVAVGVKDAAGIHKHVQARATLLPEGRVRLDVGSIDIGQDVRESLRKVAMDALVVPADFIDLAETTSTSVVPPDMGTVSSGGATMMGRAVTEAIAGLGERYHEMSHGRGSPQTLREMLLEMGSETPSVAALEFLAEHAPLEFSGTVRTATNGEAPLGAYTPFWETAWGAAAVHVDESTGQVGVEALATASDVGKAIQLRVCEGQEVGASVMGLGQALFEGFQSTPYGPQEDGLRGYRYPKASDALSAHLESHILEQGLGPGPGGAKGAGEGAILVVAPAIGNAIALSTGAQLCASPMTPERVWRGLAARRQPGRGSSPDGAIGPHPNDDASDVT